MKMQFILTVLSFSFVHTCSFAMDQNPTPSDSTRIVQEAQEAFNKLAATVSKESPISIPSKKTEDAFNEALNKITTALMLLKKQKVSAPSMDGECIDDEGEEDDIQADIDLLLYELYDLSKDGIYGKKMGISQSFEELEESKKVVTDIEVF